MNKLLSIAIALVVGAVLLPTNRAEACGCFSPPIPTVDEVDFAVNQQSEQIVFEVNDDETVTAHVLILYNGKPESFAWLLPTVGVPRLDLSENLMFGIVDQLTAPVATTFPRNICPEPEYRCQQKTLPFCPGDEDPSGGGADAGFSDTGIGAPPGEGDVGGVEVLGREVVGSYETVTFRAGDTALAVEWLQEEGFIVNDTTAPFMMPYAEAGMSFVAARLVPEADVSEIRPLKITYDHPRPMIPLRLTAVAAEPELTVTAYIYADEPYGPMEQPFATVDASRISYTDGADGEPRSNYPMVLSRAVDEAGGDAFVVEFAGTPPVPSFGSGTRCCGDSDWCGLGNNGVCECPSSDFDDADCSDSLMTAIGVVNQLAADHTFVTRLTTRVSAHEMTFDPEFHPDSTASAGTRVYSSNRLSLSRCRSDVIEQARVDEIEAAQTCATTYCGIGGECVVTADGPGCVCAEGQTARSFTDLDGQRSVTCMPATTPIDLSAGGVELPDACVAASCGEGSCIDIGGFPTCQCEAGNAAVGTDDLVTCVPVVRELGTPGAEDFTADLEDVRVCAPAPPTSCGPFGWLVRQEILDRRGQMCASSMPNPDLLIEPRDPTCADVMAGEYTGPPAGGGGGCSVSVASNAALGFSCLLAMLAVMRRRRQ